MKRRSSRSLKATPEGIKVANKAILKFATKIELAVEIEVSRATVQNFFAGKPIDRENFHKICEKLGLSWQEIADLPDTYSVKTNQETLRSELNEASQIWKQIQADIQHKYGRIRTLDMSYPRPLQELYTNMNVLKSISSRRWLEIEELQPYQLSDSNDLDLCNANKQKLSGLQAVQNYSKLIILGKPGSGKTTFLKHLATECAFGKLRYQIPIFISLKNFAASSHTSSLSTYINQELANYNVDAILTSQILNQGKALILLDGLDEVRQKEVHRVLQQINQFSTKYHSNQFIITCRIASLDYNLEQFTEVELADFDQSQITEFVHKWFADTQVKSHQFLLKLHQNSRLRELATNPLLLTLLCLVFAEARDFPANRANLYQEALNILLKKWDAKRHVERDELYEYLSVQRKHDLLGYIARNTFERGEYFFKQQDLEQHITNYITSLSDVSLDWQLRLDPEALLKAIEAQHGLLVERARGIYSFSHITFQEYLAAKNIVLNIETQASKIALTQLVSRITDKRWREVFILCAGMLSQADYLLLLAKKHIDDLLVNEPQLIHFLNWLNTKAQNMRGSCPSVIIRAFYLDLELARACNTTAGRLELAKACHSEFARYLDEQLCLDLALDRVLTINNVLGTTKPHLIYHRVLDRAIMRADSIAPELKQVLTMLKQRAIQCTQNDENRFIEWWRLFGQDEVKILQNAVIVHRNFAHHWHFSTYQQNLFKQYYYANTLLLNCLKSKCQVSSEVRQEIENSLLLSSKLFQVAI
ncbi:NACHT domain-containing NTPase [Chroococcidiopsis sp. TS-821]|uniref:NACHT domain-containing protein n=1 Tax=Chroococcidiopsis sp. TS-821 TaxID=1378066 RepID=UPI000CEE1E3A|nr:NACHT domain-containing NTPase [Chroococcidiopsis sp. TS-821]PPS45241.1 hypothetical protein B1A85_02980 [Chroococcidiopsis sp. TS-821]